jgi:hypothetical protein
MLRNFLVSEGEITIIQLIERCRRLLRPYGRFRIEFELPKVESVRRGFLLRLRGVGGEGKLTEIKSIRIGGGCRFLPQRGGLLVKGELAIIEALCRAGRLFLMRRLFLMLRQFGNQAKVREIRCGSGFSRRLLREFRRFGGKIKICKIRNILLRRPLVQ